MKKAVKYLSIIFSCSIIFFTLNSCEDFWYPSYTYDDGGTGGNVGEGSTGNFDINATSNNTVYSLENVKITGLSHDNAQYITISLISPQGSSVTLVDQEGSGNDYNGTYTFVDRGDSDGLNRIVTYSGTVVPETYQAEDNFTSIEGDEVQGTWTLRIYNRTGSADTCDFTAWEFTIKEQSSSE